MPQPTLDELGRMFHYAFHDDPDYPSAKPRLRQVEIDGPFSVGGRPVVPIELFHGRLPVLGFRFGPFAYCTDCSVVPDSSLALLGGLDVLILDALRRTPHPAHFTIDEAVEMARKIGAKQTYFTHMTHELAHEATNAELPDGVALGYDGLRISV